VSITAVIPIVLSPAGANVMSSRVVFVDISRPVLESD
jgi:hypothetical protein